MGGYNWTYQDHWAHLNSFIEADQGSQEKQAYSNEDRPIGERDAVQIGPEHQVGGDHEHRRDVSDDQQPDKTQPSCYNGRDEIRDAESKRREQAQDESLKYHSANSLSCSQQADSPRLRPSEPAGQFLLCRHPEIPARVALHSLAYHSTLAMSCTLNKDDVSNAAVRELLVVLGWKA